MLEKSTLKSYKTNFIHNPGMVSLLCVLGGSVVRFFFFILNVIKNASAWFTLGEDDEKNFRSCDD
jgi:hypothetical protein